MSPRPAISSSPRHSLRRYFLRIVFLLALCYPGVIVLLLFFETRLLFRPVKASEDWNDPPDPRVEDVTLHSADGTRLHAWWCPPESWQPNDGATLYCHGNYGNLSQRGQSI